MPLSLEGRNLDKYRVLESLGRGGMARVYRAYHPQLDRYVAIKVMRPDLVEEEEFLTRFRREAQAVAALRHTNIVQVYDFDVEDDVYYMVMELLEGDTLKARLRDYQRRDERMPLGDMLRVLLDVLDGLAYAHSEGIVHRDIKPANVMLTRRGQAVVADFGITQIIGGTRHTVSGALMGTLDYMSPEQGWENKCDARSDLYSLGIVFYEILTQRTPFDADTPLAVLMKHLNDPLPLPRKIDPTIPDAFERIVLKALAKEPDDRYQSAKEMAEALYQAAEETETELPACISLPLSFTTPEARSESVAVFSGTARERIPADEDADEDTDATLGERLKVKQAAAQAPGDPPPSAEAVGVDYKAVGTAATGFVVRAGGAAWELAAFFRRMRVLPALPESLGWAIANSVGLLIIANLLIMWFAGLSGQWDIWGIIWPVELLLVGFGLFSMMYAGGWTWLLIPAGIVTGNGCIFSYYVLTGAWKQWAFCWPLEPLLCAGVIIASGRLASQSKTKRKEMVRLLSWTFGWVGLLLAMFMAVVASVVSVLF